MRYQLEIEGGFAGISKTYTGELQLDDIREQQIRRVLKEKPPSTDPNLRDHLRYQLQVTIKEKRYTGEYNDMNLPDEIRDLIAEITRPEFG